MKKILLIVAACMVTSLGFAATQANSNQSVKLVNKVYTISQFDNTQFPDSFQSQVAPLTNQQRVFKEFASQGYITIVNHGVTAGVLSINGKSIDLTPYLSKGTFTLDISNFVRSGQNSLEIDGITPTSGASLNAYVPYPTLVKGTPESVGMNPYYIDQANKMIAADVDKGKGLPGAEILVIKDGVIVDQKAFGYANEYDTQGVQLPQANWIKLHKDTMFDLASLTKMFATNFSLMHMEYTGQLNMTNPLQKYIPDYQFPNITCEQIAEHSAGYAPEVLFYEEDGGGAGPQFYSQNRDKTLNLIETQVPQVYTPGTKNVYSDTDFMLMGDLIEHISNTTEDNYVLNTFYKPLNLQRITYQPLNHGISLKDISATALTGNIETPSQYSDFPNRRTALIWGHPQDEKAFYSMGEVSGHAGLFGDAYDVGVLEQVVLNGGGYGDNKFFDQNTIDQFCKPTDSDPTYGIGWRRAGDSYSMKFDYGAYASPEAISHTGFTGQIAVVDPQYNLAIVLLTNRTQSTQLSKTSFAADKYQTTNYGDVINEVYKSILNN